MSCGSVIKVTQNYGTFTRTPHTMCVGAYLDSNSNAAAATLKFKRYDTDLEK
jgi:hypothetical protein